MLTSAARNDASDESYDNFLQLMNDGNSTAGVFGTERPGTAAGAAATPRDVRREETALVGPPQSADAGGAAPRDDGGAAEKPAEEEGEEEEEGLTIPESTHSFLFTESARSPPFWLGAGVAAVSAASLVLALWNNVENGSVPANVLPSVRCAQFMCEF